MQDTQSAHDLPPPALPKRSEMEQMNQSRSCRKIDEKKKNDELFEYDDEVIWPYGAINHSCFFEMVHNINK